MFAIQPENQFNEENKIEIDCFKIFSDENKLLIEFLRVDVNVLKVHITEF